MRRVILMRHAKSSWGQSGLDDHARPLNGRGRRSAKALGAWLRDRNFTPDQILSSTSQRTRETCEQLGFEVKTRFLDSLYHADPDDLLGALQQGEGACVLLLGHNPGIGDFAQDIVDTPPDHARFADYPTGATLVVTFDINDWSALHPGMRGHVEGFIVPRELVD
ncbi:MAG: SixA phosphatase family protein [Pseudomonadota bacterium]